MRGQKDHIVPAMMVAIDARRYVRTKAREMDMDRRSDTIDEQRLGRSLGGTGNQKSTRLDPCKRRVEVAAARYFHAASDWLRCNDTRPPRIYTLATQVTDVIRSCCLR